MKKPCCLVHPCPIQIGFSPRLLSFELQGQEGKGNKTNLCHTKLHRVYNTVSCSLCKRLRPIYLHVKFKKFLWQKPFLSFQLIICQKQNVLIFLYIPNFFQFLYTVDQLIVLSRWRNNCDNDEYQLLLGANQTFLMYKPNVTP